MGDEMPRPFTIEVVIEESSFGSVMRKLDGMPGVININWDADRDRGKKAKPNGTAGKPRQPRPAYDKPARDVLLEALHGKSMRSGEIRDAFVAAGRAPSSFASVIHLLKQSGDVQSTSEGYTLTKKARDRMRHKSKRK